MNYFNGTPARDLECTDIKVTGPWIYGFYTNYTDTYEGNGRVYLDAETYFDILLNITGMSAPSFPPNESRRGI